MCKSITLCTLPIKEIEKRIDALRYSTSRNKAAKKAGITKSAMGSWCDKWDMHKYIGTALGKQKQIVKSLERINEKSKRRKPITEEEILQTLLDTGSEEQTAKKLKITVSLLKYHHRLNKWPNLNTCKRFKWMHKKNIYKALEKLGERKTRTSRLARNLFTCGFMIPVCGFQNTPHGINYDHKDKIGGWNCEMFGPADYDPEEPFAWSGQTMNWKSGFSIDHIDGQGWNDHWHNLRVLCDICHQFTPTFGWRKSNQIKRKEKKYAKRSTKRTR